MQGLRRYIGLRLTYGSGIQLPEFKSKWEMKLELSDIELEDLHEDVVGLPCTSSLI